MKKIISAIALVLVFALCIPVVAMAANSPVAPSTYVCEVVSNNPNAGSANKVDMGNNVYEITATPTDGYKFVEWKITGEHKVEPGSTPEKLIITAINGDVKAVAVFNAVDADVDGKPTSPVTGDSMVYVLVLVSLVALAGAGFAFKKVRA